MEKNYIMSGLILEHRHIAQTFLTIVISQYNINFGLLLHDHPEKIMFVNYSHQFGAHFGSNYISGEFCALR